MSKDSVVIGIDVGGTKIAAGLVDAQGHVLVSGRYPTNVREGRAGLLGQIVTVGKEYKERAVAWGKAPVAMGIATPGNIDHRTGVVRFATTSLPGWTGTLLGDFVRESVSLPCTVENDANAACYAEYRVGAGVGFADMLYISVGTGIGGGLIVDGNLVRGFSGSAGGIGHVSIDSSSDQRCYCGNYGCVELYASGKAIASRLQLMPELSATVIDRHRTADDTTEDGEALSEVRDVLHAALNGELFAQRFVHNLGKELGQATASAVNLVNPQAVIVGGGIAMASGELFLGPLRDTVKSQVFPPIRERIQVCQANLGNHAGLIGAALLALDSRERTPK